MSGAFRRGLAALVLAAPIARAQTVPGLGTVVFPTSTRVPAAQLAFARGVLLLHVFEYPSAADAFREARRLDPSLAMATWGEAMTYTHPVWNEQDQAAARAVLARAPQAPTQRERDYLSAVAVLYGDGSKARRDTLYALAMERLVAEYPADDEARLFYALSLLGLSQGVRQVPTYLRAAAIAESVFARNPRHPGAAHYWIHGMDDPDHAAGALPAARALADIAPDAGHAQHMTSHIFVALGLWDDVVQANETAIRVARAKPCGHYSAFLHYGYLEQGQIALARRLLTSCRDFARGSSPAAGAFDPDAYSFITMWSRHVLDTEDWSGTVASWSVDPGRDPAPRLSYWFTRGVATVRLGDPVAARQALAAFELAQQEISAQIAQGADPPAPDDQQFLTRNEVLRLELVGLIGGAVDTLRRAAALEDSMPYAFGPPFVNAPAHELLARALVDLGQPAEAQREYARALARAPGRAPALRGLARVRGTP